MIAYHFGTSDRRLLGCYHPPPDGTGARGVVICNPLGTEYFVAYRSIRFLAEQLSASGLHVLRFDYFGTGDSDGSDDDVTFDGCVDDALTAVEELSEASGADSIGVVGVRAGAAVSVRLAERHTVNALVLWDPCAPDDAESSGFGGGAPPGEPRSLLITTQEDGWADGRSRDVGPTLIGDSSSVHVPSTKYWKFQGFGSGGAPVDAVRETVRWLSR